MRENESLAFAAVRKIYEARQMTKQLRNIERENEAKRGVVEYLPSQIEGFFDVNEPLGNVVFSGGDATIRARAVAAAAACVFSNGYPVIVLHCGNVELERQLQNTFAYSSMLVLINRGNAIYEPLTSLSNSEIGQLFVQTGTGMYTIPSGGKYYIEALAEFLRSKGIAPYCKMFFSCPHQRLPQVVDSAAAAGRIGQKSAQQIKSLIMQGQNYRGTIETYFSRLEQQSSQVMCGKSQIGRRISLMSAAKQHLVISLDISADTNDLLLNVIASEVERIIASGIPVLLAVDDISLSSNDSVARLLHSSNSNFWRVVSSRDVYSMAGSNDAVFSDLVNSAQKIFISSHSGISCNRWANVAGEYDKAEITQSFSSSNRFHSFFSIFPGQDNATNLTISQKREQIIKPEEISKMAPNEIFVIDRVSQEIAHTTVV